MIQVQNLTKLYGSHVAVDNLSFEVRQDEVIGFLGPNGAGKSTTMNILTGYISSSSGSARIGGVDILDEPLKAKAMIGYLPEQPPLYLDMTVEAYLHFMYDLKKVKLPKNAHIAEICSLVKITDVYKRLIKNLSKGYRQRVGLAQALLGNPPILILDEPTVGLDPKQIIEIRSLITALGKHHTIILSSHILSEVQAVCQRVIVMNQGKLVADDTPANLSRMYAAQGRFVLRAYGPEREIYNALQKVRGVKELTMLGEKEPGAYDFSIEAQPGEDIRRGVFERLADRGWPMLDFHSMDPTLEDIFLQLTADGETKRGRRK